MSKFTLWVIFVLSNTWQADILLHQRKFKWLIFNDAMVFWQPWHLWSELYSERQTIFGGHGRDVTGPVTWLQQLGHSQHNKSETASLRNTNWPTGTNTEVDKVELGKRNYRQRPWPKKYGLKHAWNICLDKILNVWNQQSSCRNQVSWEQAGQEIQLKNMEKSEKLSLVSDLH